MLRRREGALDRAIRYFERALDAVTTPGWDKRYSGIALREKGCALREQTKTVDAIEAFNQSLLALDKPSDSFEVALTLREKGITLRAQGGLDEALQILENARSRFESYDERREVEATVRELVEVRKAKARMDAS